MAYPSIPLKNKKATLFPIREQGRLCPEVESGPTFARRHRLALQINKKASATLSRMTDAFVRMLYLLSNRRGAIAPIPLNGEYVS